MGAAPAPFAAPAALLLQAWLRGQAYNIVNSTQGERAYNIDVAATMLAGLVPLVVYFVSGRWFVRGIAAGAVKG